MDSLITDIGSSEEDMEFGGDGSGGFDFGGEEGDEDDFNLLSGFGGEEGGFDLGLGDAWIPGDDPMVDAIMENVELCGIDITDMSNKAFGAFLMSGGVGAGASTSSNSQSSLAMYRDLAISYSPILLALKDDDEEECSSIDSAKILLASEEYLQCSGEQLHI